MGNAVLALCSQHFRQAALLGSADYNSQNASRAGGRAPWPMLTSRGGGVRACAGGARWRIFPPGGEGGARRGGRKEGGGALALGSAAASAATPGAAAARGRSSGGGGGGGGEARRSEVRSPALLTACGWRGALGSRRRRETGRPARRGRSEPGCGGAGPAAAPPRPGGPAGVPGKGRGKGPRWRWAVPAVAGAGGVTDRAPGRAALAGGGRCFPGPPWRPSPAAPIRKWGWTAGGGSDASSALHLLKWR